MRRLRQLLQALNRQLLEFRLALNTLDWAAELERHRQACISHAQTRKVLQARLAQLDQEASLQALGVRQ